MVSHTLIFVSLARPGTLVLIDFWNFFAYSKIKNQTFFFKQGLFEKNRKKSEIAINKVVMANPVVSVVSMMHEPPSGEFHTRGKKEIEGVKIIHFVEF